MAPLLKQLMGDTTTLPVITDNKTQLDGLTMEGATGNALALVVWEWKNEIGTGANDASIEAAIGYGKYWAQKKVHMILIISCSSR